MPTILADTFTAALGHLARHDAVERHAERLGARAVFVRVVADHDAILRCEADSRERQLEDLEASP